MSDAATTLTAWGHACVSLDRAGRRLVIDPGGWSDRSALATADAVLVTHHHPDHLAADDVVAALAERPSLEVWGPATVVGELVPAGAPEERVHAVAAGAEWTAAGMSVRAVGGTHAEIHPDLDRIPNVGYVVDGAVLHPGDCVDPVGVEDVAVLLVPVAAPWLRVAGAIDLVRAVRPRVAVPIHDAVLSDVGRGLVDRLVGGMGGAGEYRRLGVGEDLTVGH